MAKYRPWQNSEAGKALGECLDKIFASGVKVETLANHLGAGITTVWRWRRKESFPQRKFAESLKELAKDTSVLQITPPHSRTTELFNEWIALELSARKKLLAAMNAYDALQV